MSVPATLILTRAELSGLMTPADYLAAVEQGFAVLAEGRAVSPAPMHLPAVDGGFHLKAAAFEHDGAWAAFKVNGNFPLNPASGRPTIQGVIILCDAATGAPLAVMDSIEITRRRTAAATALAARCLARPDSARVLICGCGDQALAQLEALAEVLPLRAGHAFDLDPAKAAAFARQAAAIAALEPTEPSAFAQAARAADVIVTCTTARSPFLDVHHVAPGTFIAAVGADSPDKSEIAPALMARSRVYADDLAQCLAMGDLRHAAAAGAMAAADVAGDLAGLVSGSVPGRGSMEEEITLFDSTGTAVQDVAAAVAVYERAKAAGVGTLLPLGAP